MGRSLLQGSIRKKLAILFLASALPAFAVMFLYGLQSREASIARSEEELLRFAAHVSAIQEKTTLAIKVLLENLALLPEIRTRIMGFPTGPSASYKCEAGVVRYAEQDSFSNTKACDRLALVLPLLQDLADAVEAGTELNR